MRKIAGTVGAFVLSVQAVSAASINASSPAGQPVEIGKFAMKSEIDCSSGPLPSAHVNNNPSHGHVTFPEVDYETKSPLANGNTLCANTKTHGIAILYTPDPGFRGVDHFDMTLNPWYGQSTDYTVAVMVGGRAPATARRVH